MRLTLRGRIINFKENHAEGIAKAKKLAKRIGVAVGITALAGAIGYKMGQQGGFEFAELPSGEEDLDDNVPEDDVFEEETSESEDIEE